MGDNHNHYILCCNTISPISFLFNTWEPCFNNNMIMLLQVDVMPACMLWIAITFKLDSRITNCHDSTNSTSPHSNMFWSHKLSFDIVTHIEFQMRKVDSLLNTYFQGLKIIKKVMALEWSSKSLLSCCSNPMKYTGTNWQTIGLS